MAKLFLDTANLEDIAAGLRRGIAAGITTNPSILAKEPRTNFHEHIAKIIALLQSYDVEIPLSVELSTIEPTAMVEQGLELIRLFGAYPGLTIKVPIGWDELAVIHKLVSQDIAVNCTCVMSVNQAFMASVVGATYVSVFWNRIKDAHGDPASVVAAIRTLFDRRQSQPQIIVGSIRHTSDIAEAIIAGADIVTVPPDFWPRLTQHPKTTEAVQQFLADFEQWSTQDE